jgi:hypothetical protein
VPGSPGGAGAPGPAPPLGLATTLQILKAVFAAKRAQYLPPPPAEGGSAPAASLADASPAAAAPPALAAALAAAGAGNGGGGLAAAAAEDVLKLLFPTGALDRGACGLLSSFVS